MSNTAPTPNAPTPVTVSRLVQAGTGLDLRVVCGNAGLERRITEPAVNRPGLALTGFFEYFAEHRVQVIGGAERTYLDSLPPEERVTRFTRLLDRPVPCVVFCRAYEPEPGFVVAAERAGIPLLISSLETMSFINRATILLDNLAAPNTQVYGSMVDILGIGVIIRGRPGIGKSECVLALIERGYSLVADDVTALRVHQDRELIGTSPPTTRDFMEVRGIGIINVPAMFGVRCIRTEKRLDLVVDLEDWNKLEDVERVGREEKFIELLGVRVPHMVLPVHPGRDIARLVEVAAFHVKLRIQGINPVDQLEERVFERMRETGGKAGG
ncbi:MAG: HPr(Ser) kinase/phosphatase [Verrucomicrobia bacterium]|nr:HPr(Ser) kinase/phosphatase [Verrucomicrobiota bacterium]